MREAGAGIQVTSTRSTAPKQQSNQTHSVKASDAAKSSRAELEREEREAAKTERKREKAEEQAEKEAEKQLRAREKIEKEQRRKAEKEQMKRDKSDTSLKYSHSASELSMSSSAADLPWREKDREPRVPVDPNAPPLKPRSTMLKKDKRKSDPGRQSRKERRSFRSSISLKLNLPDYSSSEFTARTRRDKVGTKQVRDKNVESLSHSLLKKEEFFDRKKIQPFPFIGLLCGFKLFFQPDLKGGERWSMPQGHSSKEVMQQFNNFRRDGSSFGMAMFKVMRWNLFWCFIVSTINNALRFGPPLLIWRIMINVYEDNTASNFSTWLYAAGICICSILAVVFSIYQYWLMKLIRYQLQSIVMVSAFRKILYSKYINHIENFGYISSIFGGDFLNFLDNTSNLVGLYNTPLHVIITCGVLYYFIDWVCAFPAGFFLISMVIYLVALWCLFKEKKKFQIHQKNRLRLAEEFFSLIKVIKFSSSEQPFIAKMNIQRKKEIRVLYRLSLLKAFINVIPIATVLVTISITYFVFGLVNPTANNLPTTFVIINLLILLTKSYYIMGVSFDVIWNYGLPSYRFLKKILGETAEESYFKSINVSTKYDSGSSDISLSSVRASSEKDRDISISDRSGLTMYDNQKAKLNLVNCTFKAERSNGDIFTLQDINLALENEVVCVCGENGSGKSLLLKAIVGSVHKVQGDASHEGKIAYVPQDPWIFDASILENVLFGSELDIELLKTVFTLTQLNQDFKAMPFGMLTQIGEKGGTLSGGQKQRVALARALYSQRDIYVFDDCLCQVDPLMMYQIFQNVYNFLDCGEIVILATNLANYLSLLKMVNGVIYMEKGMIAYQGSFKHCMNNYPEFAARVRAQSPSALTTAAAERTLLTPRKKVQNVEDASILRGLVAEPRRGDSKAKNLASTNPNSNVVIADEKQESGVHYIYLFRYLFLAKWLLFPTLLMLLATFAMQVFSFDWISWWAADTQLNLTVNNRTHSDIYWAMSYLGIKGAELISLFFYYVLASIIGVRISIALSMKIYDTMKAAKLSYFDKTPVGRLINYSSADTYVVDQVMPVIFSDAVFHGFTLITLLAGIGSSTWYLFVPVIPFVIVLYLPFVHMVLRGTIPMSSLLAISRTPVLSTIGTTIQGIDTIRSYNMESQFYSLFSDIYRNYIEFQMLYDISQLCAYIYSEMLGVFFQVFIYFGFVIVAVYWPSNIQDTSAYALTYGMLFPPTLRFFTIAMQSLAGKYLISFRRLYDLERDVPRERSQSSSPEMRSQWPQTGRIEFRDYTFKYGGSGAPVINHLNLTIHDREVVGLIGKSGAGKTSIFKALLRIEEPSSGSIFIDGVDYTTIPHHELRKAFALIPQDPILFQGSMRYNLDPEGERQDNELWDALESVYLKDKVTSFLHGLSYIVDENTFSKGEIQLISCARAILRKTRILLVDEGTSSLDFESEKRFAHILKTVFKNHTIICISHRLGLVEECQRLLVLKEGEVKEDGQREALARNPESLYYKMLHNIQVSNQRSPRREYRAEDFQLNVLPFTLEDGGTRLKMAKSKKDVSLNASPSMSMGVNAGEDLQSRDLSVQPRAQPRRGTITAPEDVPNMQFNNI